MQTRAPRQAGIFDTDDTDVAHLAVDAARAALLELRTRAACAAMLGEEAVDDPARLAVRRARIVGPLVGTRQYGEPGRHHPAVVVVMRQEEELVAGADALPTPGPTFSTARSSPQPSARSEVRPEVALRFLAILHDETALSS